MTTDNSERKIRTYEQMIKSAYFARIDFDDGEEVTPVYVGIASLESGKAVMKNLTKGEEYVLNCNVSDRGAQILLKGGLLKFTK
jgi:hypothetical protein